MSLPLKRFEIKFLQGAKDFLEQLDAYCLKKIFRAIEHAQFGLNIIHFKKLRDGIWEFRANCHNNQYRLFAFWDKSDTENTLVIATHGILKKSNIVPSNEINKAIELRAKYFQ